MANSNYQDESDISRSLWHEDLVEYLADPLDKRTFEQFSTDHGISLMTLYRYRKKHRDELSREVESIRRKFLSEFRSKAYKSLYGKIDKDTNALKLFFQLAGDLIERTENKTEILTPEDKKAKLQAAISKLLDEVDNGQKESSPETEKPRPE